MDIKYSIDTKAVQQMLSSLPVSIQRQIVPMAINRTAQGARTEMAREITRSYAISGADVRGRLRIVKASAKLERFSVTLDPFAGRGGRSLNLIRFLERKVSLAEARRRRKKGILKQLQFTIRRDKPRRLVYGAFIANRGRTVFIREGISRLPIRPVQTIDVPSMFAARRIIEKVIARIERDMPVQFQRAITAVTSR